MVVTNEHIDEIIELIKSSKDTKEAKEKLIRKKWKVSKQNLNFIKSVEDDTVELKNNTFYFSEAQAKAILELRLQKLTA